MPSRKKAKGKARRAAKAAAKEESQAVTANQRQESSLEAQMQRLVINNATPLKCRHGFVHLSPGEKKIFEDFINAFIAVFISSQVDLWDAFITAYEATKVEYADMYSSKLDAIISMFLASGTEYILDVEGDNDIARLYAMLACHFEELIAVEVRKTKAIFSWTKIFELHGADDHTLVSYYRKRISCSCLDEKYKEVKSVKKMGFCYNGSCSIPGRRVERKKMLYCTRCGEANYCSVECQKADWKGHKQFCQNC